MKLILVFFWSAKKERCSDPFIYGLWNEPSVKWHAINLEGKSTGVLSLWNDNNFKVKSVEYGSQWIGLSGKHVASSLKCMIIGCTQPLR